MRRQLLLCVVLTGCGFQSSAGSDAPVIDPIDAPARADAAVDAPAIDAGTDAPAPLTCWDHWRDHSVALQAPAVIAGLSTTATERDPWISDDQLRLYFWRHGATADAYLATRATVGDAFTTASKLPGLSLADRDESRVALTRDELVVVVSSNLGGSSQFDLRSATRTSRSMAFATPVPDRLVAVNTPSTQHYDPFLSGDGLRLYLAPAPTGGDQHIAMATRGSLTSNFTPAAVLSNINTTESGAGDSDPALSPDERVIVFSSNRSGGQGNGDLYYATRPDAGQPFGSPLLIPTVNGVGSDGDPMLTADGCTLYFASFHNGSFDLYTAAVTH